MPSAAPTTRSQLMNPNARRELKPVPASARSVVSTPAMGLLIWRISAARRPCCCNQSNTPGASTIPAVHHSRDSGGTTAGQHPCQQPTPRTHIDFYHICVPLLTRPSVTLQQTCGDECGMFACKPALQALCGHLQSAQQACLCTIMSMPSWGWLGPESSKTLVCKVGWFRLVALGTSLKQLHHPHHHALMRTHPHRA
jgi:hypothetical protein